ncbi:MAG: 1-acyl-sn-glycerol-3-phosphate acyltransferase [Acidimicrobiia bacterium]|nr:1-acyl-sn-glycerol-3-phosphate acyltransferase [Acidimicrobiia bacterium]
MTKSEAAGERMPRMPPAFDYRALRALAGPLFRRAFELRVEGEANLPAHGSVVLAAVHRSNSDVPFLAAASPRPVHFMAKAELFTLPVLGRWFGRLGAFPVERGQTDKAALIGAARVLDRGEILGIFPEGRIGVGASVGSVQRGAAWLALRHGATLVPAAVGGTDRVLPPHTRFPRRGRIAVVFGSPLELPGTRGRQVVDEVTEALTRALVAVYDESRGLI